MTSRWGFFAFIAVAATTGCVSSNVTVCANDRVCPEGTACDETHGLCVLQSQLDDCAGKSDGEPCSVNGSSTVCRDEVCLLQFCGDGIQNAGEECDGEDLGGDTCTAHGFYKPDGLACSASCTFDTSECAETCGDELINGVELCDGSPPVRNACTRLGYDAGLLACSTLCGAQTDACRTFGWTAEDGVTGYIQALWANGPDDVFAVGGDGVFHFDGTAWTLEAAALTGALTSVWGRPGEAFVTSSAGEVAHRVNGTWSITTLGGYLRDISGSGTDVYAVGAAPGFASYQVYRSSSGGTWNPVPGFSSPSLPVAVKAMGPTDVYVIDDVGVQHWDGSSWTRSLTAGRGLSRLYGFGQDLYATGMGVVYHHDASGWTQIIFPFQYLGALAGTAANDLYAVGEGAFHYDGTGWISIESATNAGNAVVQVAPGELLAAGQGVWRYRGDGRIDMTSKLRSNFKATFAKSATEIVAVGDNGLVARHLGDRWRLERAERSTNLLDVWGDFAVGFDSILHWNGTTWVAMAAPLPSGAVLRSVWGTSATNVYAVGDGGLALHYNGTAWTVVAVPTANGVALDFVAVWGTGVSDVYFIGNDHNVGGGYSVRGGGTTFSTATLITPLNGFLDDVWASGPGDVWLVGTGGRVYHGSATTFTLVPSGTTSDLAYIAGVSATEFRVVLEEGFAPGDQYIEWSSAGTFSEKFYFCPDVVNQQRMRLAGVAAVASGDYVVVGDNGNAVRDRNGRCTVEMGTAFAIDLTRPVSEAPNQLYFTVRMFGDNRQVMHYDGAIVSGVDSGVNDADLVWASSPTDVWTVSMSTQTRAHFNGTSWSAPTSIGFAAHAIGGSGPSDVWIVGADDLALHYDGASWTAQPIPVTSNSTTYQAVWSVGPTRAFAASWDPMIPIQCWNGASWSSCPGTSATPTGAYAAFGGSGPNDVYAVGPGNLVAHWDGAMWSTTAIEHAAGLVGVAASAPNDVFAIDYDGGMMHFDGSVWSPVSAGSLGACVGLTYSHGTYWTGAANPSAALTGLVRATTW